MPIPKNFEQQVAQFSISSPPDSRIPHPPFTQASPGGGHADGNGPGPGVHDGSGDSPGRGGKGVGGTGLIVGVLIGSHVFITHAASNNSKGITQIIDSPLGST